MGYPPKFAGSKPQSTPEYTYPNILNLDQLDVYVSNGSEYFDVKDIPTRVGYGKHYFTISFKDPENSDLYLREKSSILFELKDSQGTVIYSDLTGYDDINGAAIGYFWIKEDPLRTYDEIEEGIGYLTIVGELDNVPDAWGSVYNVRFQIPIDIRKDLPNTSPVLFQSSSLIQSSLIISESVDYDSESSVYQRSMINVSASHLETYGGQLKFVEISYNEDRANNNEYKLLTTYEVSSSGEEYEITSSDATGLNPVSNLFKTPMPRDLRRGGDVSFRLRFLNSTNEVATDITTGEEIVVSSSATFEGTPIIIEKDDNLLTGSMGIGNAVGRGFKMSGENSAYIMSQDYTGFTSGSAGSGSGILMWSGSVLSSITDDYSDGGVGLELMSDSSSYFRFRSNPKELDIRADAFFVGSEDSQYISASGGIIEISSSNFHLSSSGDVYVSGSIDATEGTNGGWRISDTFISGSTGNMILSSSGDIHTSLTGTRFVVDAEDNSAKFYSGSDADPTIILDGARDYWTYGGGEYQGDSITSQSVNSPLIEVISGSIKATNSEVYAKGLKVYSIDGQGNPTTFKAGTGVDNSGAGVYIYDITKTSTLHVARNPTEEGGQALFVSTIGSASSDIDGINSTIKQDMVDVTAGTDTKAVYGYALGTNSGSNYGIYGKATNSLGNAYAGYFEGDVHMEDDLEVEGNISGSSTSTGSFGKVIGDGSELYGLPSAAVSSYTSASDNRVLTSVDESSIAGESNLTFDGSTLEVIGNVSGSSTSTGSFGTGYFGGKVGIGATNPDALLNISGSGDEEFFLVKSESFISHVINAEGVLKFGGFTTEPTPVPGGIYYNETENIFFLGI